MKLSRYSKIIKDNNKTETHDVTSNILCNHIFKMPATLGVRAAADRKWRVLNVSTKKTNLSWGPDSARDCWIFFVF